MAQDLIEKLNDLARAFADAQIREVEREGGLR